MSADKEGSGYRSADRRFGRAHDLRTSVRWPGRRGACWLPGRRVPAEPGLRAPERVTALDGRRGHRVAVLMVESEAEELTEDEMLGGVLFGHEEMQVAIDAIQALARKPASLVGNSTRRAERSAGTPLRRAVKADLGEAYRIGDKVQRQTASVSCVRRQRDAGERRSAAVRARRSRRFVRQGGEVHRAPACVERRTADRRSRSAHRAADLGRSRLPAEDARLGAVHARRNAGDRGCHARHAARRRDHRCARGHLQDRFMLHYNFPPYSIGEAGMRGARSGATSVTAGWRDAACSDGADTRVVPVHVAGRLGDHRVERIELDGERLRCLALADGCRRSDEGAGRRRRDGTGQGRQSLRGTDRHPRRRRPPRRHGLQSGRHQSWRNGAADGHQDRRCHRRDHGGRVRAGGRSAASHPG